MHGSKHHPRGFAERGESFGVDRAKDTNKEESGRSCAVPVKSKRTENRTCIYMPLVSPVDGVTLSHPVVLRGTSGGFDLYPTACNCGIPIYIRSVSVRRDID